MNKCKLKYSVIAMMLTASLGGCAHSWYPFVYHPKVSQGNIVPSNAASLLQPGMTKTQVISLLGNPVLETPLSPNTWYYLYTVHTGKKVIESRKLVLYFKGDQLVRWQATM